jgi:proteasome alpha subunit
MKPFEVEILVVEVGGGPGESSMYKIMFDGAIADHRRFAAIGADTDQLLEVLGDGWKESLTLAQGVQLGRDALARSSNGSTDLTAGNMEIAVLERKRAGRKFRRLSSEAIAELLSG